VLTNHNGGNIISTFKILILQVCYHRLIKLALTLNILSIYRSKPEKGKEGVEDMEIDKE
jgi:hypothetical protein